MTAPIKKPRPQLTGAFPEVVRRLRAGAARLVPGHACILAARLIRGSVLSERRDDNSRQAQCNKHRNQSLHRSVLS